MERWCKELNYIMQTICGVLYIIIYNQTVRQIHTHMLPRS